MLEILSLKGTLEGSCIVGLFDELLWPNISVNQKHHNTKIVPESPKFMIKTCETQK